jgi:hypothetical protein
VGLNTTPNTIGGTSILATAAYTVSGFASVAWQLQWFTTCRGVGYGTTTASTTLATAGQITINASTVPPITAVSDVVPLNTVTTIDASVTQWLYMTVTYSTSSATNSCTLQQLTLLGMN